MARVGFRSVGLAQVLRLARAHRSDAGGGGWSWASKGGPLPSHSSPAVREAFRGCVGRFRDIFEAHKDEA